MFNLCTDVDKERLGRQAIKAIHEQMDDDKDGMIEATESQEVNELLIKKNKKKIRLKYLVYSRRIRIKNRFSST